MPRGIQIGRLFGTDILMDPMFLVLPAFYFLLWGGFGDRDAVATIAVFVGALLISLLFHEFGHVLAVKWLLRTESVILLWALGGLCLYADPEGRSTPKRRIAISLMGPAFTAVLAVVFSVLALALVVAGEGDLGLAARFAGAMVLINLFLLIFNLLPIMPLDGGRALQATLELRLPAPSAERLTARVGVLTAGASVAAGIAFQFPFIAIFSAFLLFQNLRLARNRM